MLFVHYRRAQQKQVTVASSRDSWKKAKTLRVLRDNSRAFLYYFAPWNKTLQLIGGKYGNFRAALICFSSLQITCTLVYNLVKGNHFFAVNEIMSLQSHRELRRWRPVLLPVPAIFGGAQFCFLFANCWICRHPQHCLPICWEWPC